MQLVDKLRDTLDRFKAEHVGVNPMWIPLEKLLPMEWCDGFMFMQGELGPNKDINCYKHGITRKSLHIDSNGQTWKYNFMSLSTKGWYTKVDPIDAVLAVYEGIEKLGATPSTMYDDDYIVKRDQALADAGYTVVS